MFSEQLQQQQQQHRWVRVIYYAILCATCIAALISLFLALFHVRVNLIHIKRLRR